MRFELDPWDVGRGHRRIHAVVQQAARQVDIADAGGVIEGEAAGHDADDGVWGVVEFKRAADDMRIAAVVALPELVIQHSNVLAGALIVGGLDAASQQSVHTEEASRIAGEVGADDIFRERATGDLHISRQQSRADFRSIWRVLQCFKLRFHRREPARLIRVLFVDDDRVHDAICVGVGEGMEQHGVDEREHRRGGADAEGEREHGDGGEAGIAAQCAEAVTDVAAELVEDAQTDCGAICFVLRVGLAEIDACFALRLFGGEALADEVFR